MEAVEVEKSCTHVVMVPFPAQGHQNPLMRLACRLASLGGVRVTFFVNDWFVKSALAARDRQLEHLIRVEGIAEGCVEQDEMKGNSEAVLKMVRASDDMKEPIEKALKDMVRQGGSVHCIMSDALLVWCQDIADVLGIPKAGLWTSSTGCALTYSSIDSLIEQGLLPVKANLEESGNVPLDGIPGLGKFSVADLPCSLHEAELEGVRMRANRARRLASWDYLLLNTFEDLDKEAIDGLQSILDRPNCWPVGLLLPNAVLEQDSQRDLEVPAVKFGDLEEDRRCLAWLDAQEATSVVYISFGSLANLSVAQIEELALGLEASNAAFLWVIRPSLVEGLSDSSVFKGFVERQNRGLLVTWAPQLQVLGHGSVALFLTHCGWNSITEAIWNGVPLVAWPCFAEQNSNARFVVSQWKIGIAFGSDERVLLRKDLVTRSEVAAAIASALGDDRMRERMSILKSAARKAARQGGSSHGYLERLLAALRCTHEP